MDRETAHNYTSGSFGIAADFTQATFGGLQTDLKVKLTDLELRTGSGCTTGTLPDVQDAVRVIDGDTSSTLSSTYKGRMGQLWTGWLSPSAGHLQVKLAQGCYGTGSRTCQSGPSYNKSGVVMESYAYRRYDSSATSSWRSAEGAVGKFQADESAV